MSTILALLILVVIIVIGLPPIVSDPLPPLWVAPPYLHPGLLL